MSDRPRRHHPAATHLIRGSTPPSRPTGQTTGQPRRPRESSSWSVRRPSSARCRPRTGCRLKHRTRPPTDQASSDGWLDHGWQAGSGSAAGCRPRRPALRLADRRRSSCTSQRTARPHRPTDQLDWSTNSTTACPGMTFGSSRVCPAPSRQCPCQRRCHRHPPRALTARPMGRWCRQFV
jgi:hypothetical protein